MVACETMSARLADGDSVYETGKVGHANEAATDLGVRPGQPIQEAARLLLKAPPGKVIEPEGISEKNTITVLDETENGTVYASWGLPVLKKIQEPHPDAVFVQGSHSGQTIVAEIIRLQVKGVITNDAGRGKDDSGIAAAAVGTMSARVGETMSTWNDGIISCMNDVAGSRGVLPGMGVREAAGKMLIS